MLVIASSLSCATFNITFTVILAIFSVIALLIMEAVSPLTKGKVHGGMLVIRGPKQQETAAVIETIQNELDISLRKGSLHSVSCEEDICITYVFHKTKNSNINEIISKLLNQYPDFKFNLMVNRTATL